jgi:PAS domain S-box-containing protein
LQAPRLANEQADRSQLEQIIAGLSEGVVLIEPDQTITYANEAALRMHGVQTPQELGRTVDEYRQNFTLRYRNNRPITPDAYSIDQVVAGEAFDDVVVQVVPRRRPEEDRVHRIRSLVITNRAGQPDCLVLIMADVSEQFEAEDRFERTFAANPAPAVICRLADQRFIKLNEGFLDMTGYKREEVLGRTLYDIDVLKGAERRDLAIERLRVGETIPQMEALLKVPNDAEKLVIVAGQPLEVQDEPCMLFSFADLEPRRKAEREQRSSEERFNKIFRLAPIPMMVEAADGHQVVDINDAFSTVTGYSFSDLGEHQSDGLHFWVDDEARRQFRRQLTKTGSVRNHEAKLRCKDGTELACLIAGETATINNQASILCTFQDISTRKRSEAELVAAIEAVMADASWFSQAVVEKLAALRAPSRPGQPRASTGGLADLTGRERDVLAKICRGLSDAEISDELKLSPNTVRNHVASLYRKIGVNRRSGVIVWARERGFGDGELPKRQMRHKTSKK